MHHDICACSLLASGRIPNSKSGKQKLSRISVILATKNRRASDNGRRDACQVKSLASSGTGPQETTREEEHLLMGHSWRDVGSGIISELGNVTDGLDLRVRRKQLSSLFESISNLPSSEIVWSQRLMDSASTGWNGGGEMDGTEEMGRENSSWRPIFCLLSLWIHFILHRMQGGKKGVTISHHTKAHHFSMKLLLLVFPPYGNVLGPP